MDIRIKALYYLLLGEVPKNQDRYVSAYYTSFFFNSSRGYTDWLNNRRFAVDTILQDLLKESNM